MTEEEKSPTVPPQEPASSQDPQQLQALVKQTMKENKSLQNKNSKLQSKYVELFKENKGLKTDKNNYVNFLTQLFSTEEGKSNFVEAPLGQSNPQ